MKLEDITDESIESVSKLFPEVPAGALRVVAFAAEFASHMHKDQTRKVSGDPYFVHPMRVAQAVAEHVRPEGVAAALLHDVVEDVGFVKKKVVEMTSTMRLFPARVRELVRTLTHLPCNSKEQMLERISRSMDTDAMLIKMADRTDNLMDGASFGSRWLKKYATQGQILLGGANFVGLENHPITKKLKRVINASILKANREKSKA